MSYIAQQLTKKLSQTGRLGQGSAKLIIENPEQDEENVSSEIEAYLRDGQNVIYFTPSILTEESMNNIK